MALTKISTGGVKDDSVTNPKVASNAAIQLSKLEVIASNKIVGNDSGNAVPKELTPAEVRTILNINDGANNYTHPNHSGEVTSTADGAQVIASDVVDEDNLKISNSGTNGQFLQKQSGNTGGLTWADVTIPPAGNTIDLVADGAIAAGKPVIITTAGKAAQVGLVPQAKTSCPDDQGSAELSNVTSGANSSYGLVWNPDRNRMILSSRGSHSSQANGRTTSIEYSTTLGTDTATHKSVSNYVGSSTQKNTSIAYDPDTDQTIIAYRLNNDVYVSLMSLDSSDNITYGNRIEVASSVNPDNIRVVYDTNSNRVIIIWRNGGNNKMYARAGIANATTNGDVGSFGTTIEIETHTTVDGGMDACWDSTNNKVLVVYKNTYGSGGYPHAFAISCSGTTLTQGGRYQIMNIEISAFIRCAFDSDQGKAMVNYTMASNNKLVRQAFWISSGTTIADGAEATVARGGTDIQMEGYDLCYDPGSKKFYTAGAHKNDSKKPILIQHEINSSNAITNSSTSQFDGSGNIALDQQKNWAIAPLGSSGKIAVVFANDSNSSQPDMMLFETMQSTTNITTSSSNSVLNYTNILGFAEDAISDGNTGTIKLPGNVVGNQSGLTAGTFYYHKPDGTLATSGDGGIYNAKAGIAVSSSKLVIADPNQQS